MMGALFINRQEAGVRLAKRLLEYRGRPDVLVLALPRGGVVTGFEIALRLAAELDVLIVRKIGVPWQPELAAGAVSETGTVYLNRDILTAIGGLDDYLEREIAGQKMEISRRAALYRSGKAIKDLKDRTIILVDDGIATGATMKAAIETLKKEPIAKLVVAVPVAPPRVVEELKDIVGTFVCIATPEPFEAVGRFYTYFAQTTDEEVVQLLKQADAALKRQAA